MSRFMHFSKYKLSVSSHLKLFCIPSRGHDSGSDVDGNKNEVGDDGGKGGEVGGDGDDGHEGRRLCSVSGSSSSSS